MPNFPSDLLKQTINQARSDLKNDDVVKKMFKEYGLKIDELSLVPIVFSDLEVSARTQHGIIYLNYALLSEEGIFPENKYHYLTHELTHFCQQTTGDGPTQGSTDDDYLENPYEVDAFREQTKYISENEGDEKAKMYITKVLDHHDIEGKEREEKRKKLLRLNAMQVISKQLSLKFPMNKSQEKLMEEYDEAIGKGPQENHHRTIVIQPISNKEKELRLQKLKELMKAIRE